MAALTPSLGAESLREVTRLNDLQGVIAEAEYDIRWQPTAKALMAPNRSQNLRVTFDGDGFEVVPRVTEDESLPLNRARF